MAEGVDTMSEKTEQSSQLKSLQEKIRWFLDQKPETVRKMDPNDIIGLVKQLVAYQQELEAANADLTESRSIESITALAGGIAHKFNNSLSTVMGNVELLRMTNPGDEKISKYTDRVLTATRQMADLTNQLLAYAEEQKYRVKSGRLTDFVRDSLRLIQGRIDPAIRVETDLHLDTYKVNADQMQIQMLISGLVENSVEAIDGTGSIRIRIRNVNVDEEMAERFSGLRKGAYACLQVSDDGRGMDEETKRKIFEPFFSTNFQGRGLGMAAIYGIVKNLKGWIGVESELGKGTMVSIYLPGVDAGIKALLQPVQELPKTATLQSRRHILLIEDEIMVIEMSQKMIETMGYPVLVAKSGEEAVRIVKNFDGEIAIAFLDIGLPDIPGEELYPLLRSARPDMKIIVCSGYSTEGPVQDLLDAGAHAFIQKPFTFQKMSEKLRELAEIRRFQRFKVIADAMVSLSSDPTVQGRVINISRGGLAFKPLGQKEWEKGSTDLQLNLTGDEIQMNAIPFKTVSDLDIENASAGDSTPQKRMGVQFGELTPRQIDQLEHFIESVQTVPE